MQKAQENNRMRRAVKRGKERVRETHIKSATYRNDTIQMVTKHIAFLQTKTRKFWKV